MTRIPAPFFLTLFLLTLFLTIQASAQNADAVRFDLSDPAWTLSSGKGQRTDADGKTVLEITGTGEDSNAWELPDVPLLPGRTAMLRFQARRTAGFGGGMTGFSFANFDIPIDSDWKPVSLIFTVPKEMTSAKIRLGQWMISGTLQFSDVEFTYLTPSYSDCGLGDDESVVFGDSGPVYMYGSLLGGSQGNFSRTFVESNVSFNSNRWCFGGRGCVIHRFDAPSFGEQRFFGGKLSFSIGYYIRGKLTAQYSVDGETWNDCTSVEAAASGEFQLPVTAEGVKSVWFRFISSKDANLQLYSFQFEAPLTPPVTENADSEAKAAAENTPIGTQKAGIRGTTCFWELISGDEGFLKVIPPLSELPKTQCGEQVYEKTFKWTEKDGDSDVQKSAHVRCKYFVADFYREDFGKTLDASCGALGLWWCDAVRKVTQTRGIPTEKAAPNSGLEMSAARNDYESCQLVLRPEKELTLEKVQVSPLKNADGTEIAPENVEVRSVFYHFIDHPTDRTGVREMYPDALPALEVPHKLKAGENAPLWFTVYIPEGAAAGDYTSEVTLTLQNSADGKVFTRTVPLALHVWDFAIPTQNHSETAYGFSPGTAYLYHNVKTAEDRGKLNDIYYHFLAKYRISPYNPVVGDEISYNFVVDAENPEKSHTEVDFTRFDAAMEHAIQEYHFTGFNLYIPGMGGGTFQERYEPELKGFGENTAEYQALFASMVRTLESHLREKGWLKMAYVYWFDEPDKKDYEFVKNGMNRIKKYAPGLQTMLTEEPSEEVINGDLLGKIDIWCPVSPNFNEELAEKCREKGERFWWYVCCWPHEPYCTEFIDHNAIEMRMWLWQTWKYDIVGTLIWTTNYWNSSSAFPDSYQNPYLDPMSYVSGYDTPAGTERFWGNGDGRFYYPPLACAVPDRSENAVPNFDAPVPCIRLEMLREGLEDYEMLYLLRERLSDPDVQKSLPAEKRMKYENLLKVPDSMTSSKTQFSTDPEVIFMRRKAVAEAIEALR